MTDERTTPSPENEREHDKPPAKISLIYESKDGRFCLFEDAEGHITAVRASSLA